MASWDIYSLGEEDHTIVDTEYVLAQEWAWLDCHFLTCYEWLGELS